MKKMKLDDLVLDSEIQKEVDRIALKYKSYDEECETVGENPVMHCDEKMYESVEISDEHIVNELRKI